MRREMELLVDFNLNHLSKQKSQPLNRSRRLTHHLVKNCDIKCFKCFGSGHIASQCINKRVMLMIDCGEVITDDESDGEVEDNMPGLVEDSEEELEAEGQSLIARRALSA